MYTNEQYLPANDRQPSDCQVNTKSGSVQTNGIHTYYDIRGDGPWLVLSHSLACDHTMWDDQIDTLSHSYRVLRYDTRGHGRSSAPSGPYTLELLADDLKALLDVLGVGSAHFVGLSMGGMIGQTFALKYPGVFHTLVLCDTTSMYPPETGLLWENRIRIANEAGMPALAQPILERWFTPKLHDGRPEVIERFAKMIASTPLGGYVACSRALPPIDVTARLPEIDVPTLVIVGEHDQGTPLSMAQTIHESISGSELVVISDAAHFPNIERAGAFNTAILDFFARHRQQDGSTFVEET